MTVAGLVPALNSFMALTMYALSNPASNGIPPSLWPLVPWQPVHVAAQLRPSMFLSAASVEMLAPASSVAASMMPCLIMALLLSNMAVTRLAVHTRYSRPNGGATVPACPGARDVSKKSRTSSVRLGLRHCVGSGETFFLGFVEKKPGLAVGVHVDGNLAAARKTSEQELVGQCSA